LHDLKINTLNSDVYRPDERFNIYQGVNPESLTKAFNNIFILYWECTPFAEEHKLPTILMSINNDKTANFSYVDGDPNDLESVKGCSCWYTVDHDGFAHVKEFNEILDMKNMVHVNAIAATIIRDIFGDFDMAEAGQKFINNMLQESQKRNQN
jgi:hypothetical protein